jgi:acyl carrier protein
MSDANNEKLQDIFRAVFELHATADVARMGQRTHPNWDSLRHVMLVAALESEFNICLDAADALRITSFETTQQLLQERGAKHPSYSR